MSSATDSASERTPIGLEMSHPASFLALPISPRQAGSANPRELGTWPLHCMSNRIGHKVMAETLEAAHRPLALLYCGDSLSGEMARLTLKSEGYGVQEASSPREFEHRCSQERPGLVVVDEEALVTIPEHPTTPTLVLLSSASPLTTAESHEIAALHAVAGSAVHYLPAPFSPLELSRAARRLRSMWRPRSSLSKHQPIYPELEG